MARITFPRCERLVGRIMKAAAKKMARETTMATERPGTQWTLASDSFISACSRSDLPTGTFILPSIREIVVPFAITRIHQSVDMSLVLVSQLHHAVPITMYQTRATTKKTKECHKRTTETEWVKRWRSEVEISGWLEGAREEIIERVIRSALSKPSVR